MNKKQLYESIMKNVAKTIKKQLKESEYDDYDFQDADDMTEIIEAWENAFEYWLNSHVNETAVFVPLMLIGNGNWDNDQVARWVESIMQLIESDENLIIDEVFIDAITNWLISYAAADIYNKALAELKNIDTYEQNEI